jgi:hypothetical protein
MMMMMMMMTGFLQYSSTTLLQYSGTHWVHTCCGAAATAVAVATVTAA